MYFNEHLDEIDLTPYLAPLAQKEGDTFRYPIKYEHEDDEENNGDENNKSVLINWFDWFNPVWALHTRWKAFELIPRVKQLGLEIEDRKKRNLLEKNKIPKEQAEQYLNENKDLWKP